MAPLPLVVSDDAGPPTSPSSGQEGVVRTRYDWADTSPSAAVIETVAVASDREPTRLPPLYGVIDPDALDALRGPESSVRGAGTVQLTFPYAGHEVTVRSDGEVVVGSQRRTV